MRSFTLQLQRLAYEVRRRTFRPYVVRKVLGGAHFDFLVGDYVGAQWYGRGSGDMSPELRFLRDLVGPGDVVIDAGAHHGFVTLLLSEWVGPEGMVVAVEAMPQNVQILRRNIELNQRQNVRVEWGAIGDREGFTEISHRSNASIVSRSAGASLRVPMRTLGSFSAIAPTLVKLDIEGAEVAALLGAEKLLRARPKWAIETHIPELRAYGDNADAIPHLLAGYNLWLQPHGEAEPAPYQGESLLSLKGPQIHLYAIP